eukprot:3172054-Alexandrium_andersonii.AAC.1
MQWLLQLTQASVGAGGSVPAATRPTPSAGHRAAPPPLGERGGALLRGAGEGCARAGGLGHRPRR